MIIDNTLSNRIANVSFVCACLVVLIHIDPDGWDYNVWLVRNRQFLSGLFECAVPCFFMISGIFCCKGLEQYGPKMLIRKRVKTLLIPLLTLNFLVCLMAYLEILCGVHFEISRQLGSISVESFLRAFGIGKTRFMVHSVLWYVRCLLILVCMSPMIYRVIRLPSIQKWGCLLVLFCGDFAWWYFAPNCLFRFQYWFNPDALLYFSLGMLLARTDTKLQPNRKWWVLVLLLPLGSFIAGSCLDCQIFERLLKKFVVAPLGIVGLFALVPSWRFPNVLVRNSFAIYVTHTIVLHYFSLALLSCNVDLLSLPVYWLMWIVAVAASIGISEIIHRCFPSLVPWLFGGR